LAKFARVSYEPELHPTDPALEGTIGPRYWDDVGERLVAPASPLRSSSPPPRRYGLNHDGFREAVGKPLKILLVGGQNRRPTATRGEHNMGVDNISGFGSGQQRSDLMRLVTGEADDLTTAKEPPQLNLA
jgi:hypothetical protein